MIDFDTLWNFLIAQIKTNQFLTGATITGAIMGVVYFLRAKIFQLYGMVKRFFNVSLTIHSEDPLYIPVSRWLYAHNFDRLARNYRVRYVSGKATYGPSEGSFWFVHDGQILRVSIARDQANNQNSWRSQTREFLTISYYSLKRSRAIIDGIIRDAVEEYRNDEKGVAVYVHNGHWCHVTEIPRRAKPSVVLAGDALERIEADLTSFLERKEWYHDRGVPYHRGYLLTGPPGTGKTSLVRHLAQRFGMPAYVSDGTINSITTVPPKSILLIEDVDSITKVREAAKAIRGSKPISSQPTQASGTAAPAEEPFYAPSLSELLNALDGVASTDEVIVIMTTNHPERLDPAVIRPGRVDYRLHLGPATREQAVKMFTKFYGEEHAPYFAAMIDDGEYTPAQLQEMFIRSETPMDVFHEIAHRERLAA